MNHVSVRRNALTLAVMATAIVTTACEDKRVKELHEGIPRDSAVSKLSEDVKHGSGADATPNVYTSSRYLINGKNYEVLFFTPNNEKKGRDSVPSAKLTPIVFVDNRMVGKGWQYWDSVSAANKIPLQKR
jgi:hypothetical protein